MLLKRQIAIDGDKYFKFGRRQGQQLTVRYSHPPLFGNSAHIEHAKAGCQPRIDAFVEQYFQAASVTARLVARSRNAITFDRDTEGNPARNSSMESPASRHSSSVCTGTRVPGKTGTPLITSGDAVTTGLLIRDTINQRPAVVQKGL